MKALHAVVGTSRHRALHLLVVLCMLGSTLPAGTALATESTPPPQASTTVMVAGDSVPNGLMPTLQALGADRDWLVVDAAQGGCGVRGDLLVNSRNRPFVHGGRCPELVPPLQRAGLAQDPDVVVWWDRWTVADFRKPDGTHVRGGTVRWWRLRKASLARHADRLTKGGAELVLIATEPVGTGIYTRCRPGACHEWHRRLIQHHREYIHTWNIVMRDFAASRSDVHFRTVTRAICRDREVPCDDRVAGTKSRADGVHFSDHRGRISAAVVRRLETVVAALPADAP